MGYNGWVVTLVQIQKVGTARRETECSPCFRQSDTYVAHLNTRYHEYRFPGKTSQKKYH